MNPASLVRKRRLMVAAATLASVGAAILLVATTAEWQPREVQADAIPAADPGGSNRVPVVLSVAKEIVFEQRVEMSGSVRASRYALVSARIPGTLDKVFVDEGDRVEAGATRLFQTDSLKLTTAAAIAEQALKVAESALREKQAALRKAFAVLEQSQSDLERYDRLVEKRAIAEQLHEQQRSLCKQSAADVEHAEALVALAEAQAEQARLNVAIAQKDLADSLVLAPISGKISTRFREPGETAAAGTPVLRIDDPTLLEVSVFLPEEHYTNVTPGKTRMRVRAGGADLGECEVTYKSPTVDEEMRTFEVKSLVELPPQGVAPGCLAEVILVADSRRGIGVPVEAVQVRGDRTVVFSVENGTVKMLPVEVGRELDGWREILAGLAAGTPVVSMGQFLVEEGASVVVQEEGA